MTRRGLGAYALRYLEWLQTQNYSARTVQNRESYLGEFVLWCAERGLTTPRDITKPILERYQRSLYLPPQGGRRAAHVPRPARAAHPGPGLLQVAGEAEPPALQPGGELELPRLEKRLPKHVLTASEVEAVLAVPD